MYTLTDIVKNPKPMEGGIYNYLPPEMNLIKQVEVETYSHRAQFFDEKKALSMGRPSFTAPLREKGKDGTIFFEIAGGSASHALNMMKDGFQMVETDIAPGSVRRSKEFAEKLGIAENNFFFAMDAENLPFKDESMDGGFMIASLHHIPDVKKALLEIYRSLKPGGVFLIGYEPAAWQYYLFYPLIVFFRWIIRMRNKGRPISLADDVTFGFSKRKLGKLLKEAGFSSWTITPTYYFYKAYKNYRILIAKLFKKPESEHPVVKAFFLGVDEKIARMPLLKNLTWDWDVVARK